MSESKNELVEVSKTVGVKNNIEKISEITSNCFVRIEDVANNWRLDDVNQENFAGCLISGRIESVIFESSAREEN